MKKSKVCIIVFLTVLISFIGCDSKKENELNQKIAELTELNSSFKNEISELKNQIEELENQNTELTNELNNLKASIAEKKNESSYENKIVENHDISYSLKFEYDGLNIKLFSEPDFGNEIYTIQKDDEIQITNIIRVIENDYVANIIRTIENDYIFVKAKLISNPSIEGYIFLGQNPYENGNFEPSELLEVAENKIQTLKLDSTFIISEGTSIRELPSENSNSIHVVTHKEGGDYYKSSQITSDYQWVKITLGEYTGWVPANTLSRDVGGPTIYTPETTIRWNLIDSNLI